MNLAIVTDLILKSVHSADDILHLLAFLLLGFVGSVAQWDEDGRLFGLRQVEELLAFHGIEVADPAGGQSLFRGSQAEMLHCYGDVDVSIVLAVSPYPFLVVQYGGDDVERCRLEPLTGIALLQPGLFIVATDDMESPWLLVDRRRGVSHALHDVVDFLLLHVAGLIVPAAVAVLHKFQ